MDLKGCWLSGGDRLPANSARLKVCFSFFGLNYSVVLLAVAVFYDL